jgi:purine-binding chemotaxis protein CheW
MDNTYLSFTICNDYFAVNVLKVLEVLQQQSVTKVPNAPSYIKGIINFRGEVVPVFESRSKFNLAERETDESFVIIILDLSTEIELFRIGAIVDKVQDVITVLDEEIMPVPVMSKDFNTEFLHGIFKIDEKFIMLLNVEKVFTDIEIYSIHESSILENK